MRLALVAGSGDLPPAIVQAAQAAGHEVMVFSLVGKPNWFDGAFEIRPDDIERLITSIRLSGADAIAVAGYAPPVALQALAALLNAMGPGRPGPVSGAADLARRAGGLVEALTGARLVGLHELAADLVAPVGAFGGPLLEAAMLGRAGEAVALARRQGLRDVGQAIIRFADGSVIEEDAAGTDALLARGGESAAPRPAILAKAAKPQQPLFADLPVIGPATIAGAAQARISVIAVEAGRTLLVERDRVIEAAASRGISLVGIAGNG